MKTISIVNEHSPGINTILTKTNLQNVLFINLRDYFMSNLVISKQFLMLND